MSNTSRVFPLLIGFGGAAFGILFLVIGRNLFTDGSDLRRNGTTVAAKIVTKLRKTEDQSWGGLENYYIRVVFSDSAGVPRESEFKVPSKVWWQLDEGQQIKLTWIQGRPETARLGPRWGLRVRAGIGVGLMLFGAAAIAIFPFFALRDWWQTR